MAYPALDDELLLIKQLASGDSEAFTAFYIHYPPIVKNYLISCSQLQPEDADDLVQEVFSIIWYKRDRLASVRSFKGYVFTIARNRLLNLQRRKINERQIFKDHSFKEPDNYQQLEDNILYEFYHKKALEARGQMPSKTRLVFNLMVVGDLSESEIAAALNISVQMVRRHILKANRLIAGYLRKNAEWVAALITSIIIIHL